MAGWGTTTLISTGKDVYIHYAARDFAFALANDPRSKAAVLYVEPGGYYEHRRRVQQAGRGLRGRTLEVQADAGRRTRRSDGGLRRQGRATRSAGSWRAFGVDGIFTPEHPVFSAKGAVVTNIAHIPAALTAVMKRNATRPDFAPARQPGAQAMDRQRPGDQVAAGARICRRRGDACPTTPRSRRSTSRSVRSFRART